jgi:hypothetical protein
MNLGRINLITPPDNLFNTNVSYLLVKPSTKVKMQFQTLLSACPDDINVYIYDTDEADVAWMLNAANNSDFIIIDIDNCDTITKNFVSLLLSQPNTYYMTNDEITPWGLISRNRIYNLDWILEILKSSEEEDDDDTEDNEEEENDERK